MSQVDVSLHMPAGQSDDVAQNNVDAHLPPQPGPPPGLVQIPGFVWIPETNEWAPSSDPVDGGGNLDNQFREQPGHSDDPTARPMSREPGGPDTGSQDSPRLNLLDSVRQPAQSTPLPVQRVEHVITTQEEGNDLVRTRTVRLDGTGPVVILEENQYRTRALLKMVTSNAVAMLYPLRQGGSGASTAGVPTAPNAGYLFATGDPVHVSESKAGIEGIVQDTGSVAYADITVWEEMSVPGDQPGIGI